MSDAAAFASAAVAELIAGRQQLSQIMEQLGPSLLSEDVDVRDAALDKMVQVVLAVPSDTLSGEQVGLLLDFLMGRIESSALHGGDILHAIRYLVLHSNNLPANCAVPIVHAVFKEGNVQAWPQKERTLMYDVLQFLLHNRLAELLPLGSDFVMTFIRSVGGERDPRCLLIVFRLFLIVAAKFNMGPLAEDLFEVVACYYPIEYKPLPGDAVSVSSEQLSVLCGQCLLANPAFAPFCYMLIEEKLTEEDTTESGKRQCCSLLARACEVFSPAAILPHLDQLLAALRVVGLNPKEKDAMSDELRVAARAVWGLLEKGARTNVKILDGAAANMLENMEPFVLQAEMGLSPRALSLLECAARSAPSAASSIADRTLSWIIMLIQGDTVNTSANRADVAKEALEELPGWVGLAADMHMGALLARYAPALFASLEAARELTPAEAVRCGYRCAEIYLRVDGNSEEDRVSRMLSCGVKSVEGEAEKAALLSLVGAFSQLHWDKFEQLVTPFTQQTDLPKLFSFVAASVHDEKSWRFFREHALVSLTWDVAGNCSSLLSLADRLRQKETLLPLIIDTIREHIHKIAEGDLSAESMNILAVFWRDLLAKANQSVLEECVSSDVFSSSDDGKTRLHLLSVYSLAMLRVKSSFGAGESDAERGMLAKADLLAGRREGLEGVRRLLQSAPFSPVHASLVNTILDFHSPPFQPTPNAYACSPLWKQRVFCQVVPVYVQAVEQCSEQESRTHLLSLLPCLLSLGEGLSGVEEVYKKLLPLLISSLSSDTSSANPAPSALVKLLPAINASDLDVLRVAELVHGLTGVVERDGALQPAVDSLSCLEWLARRGEPKAVQPWISKVVGCARVASGHRKRAVRQKAAAVRNHWELLTTK